LSFFRACRVGRSSRDLSDVAKGGDGAKSEAAIHSSPGLQPWVNRVRRHALKVMSERGSVVACGPASTDVRAPDLIKMPGPNHTLSVATFPPSSHIPGNYGGQAERFAPRPYLGLKPWAMRYGHFAAQPDRYPGQRHSLTKRAEASISHRYLSPITSNLSLLTCEAKPSTTTP
jgi:hypothetical protein